MGLCKVLVLIFTLFQVCESAFTSRTVVQPNFNCDPSCLSAHGQVRGGNFTLTVLEMTGLEDSDGWGPFSGYPDAYIVVETNGITLSSSPVRESRNPVWPDGGEDLWFGNQVSGTEIKIQVFDEDSGLEFGDDLLAKVSMNILDCSCFDDDEAADASCNKLECVEEAWIALEEGANCGFRETWPWKNGASLEAKCARIRMTIQPLRVQVVKVYEDSRDPIVTTASINDPEYPIAGAWGRFFEGNNDIVDPYNPRYSHIMGGLFVQTNTQDSNKNLHGPFMTITSNLDAQVYVLRKSDDFEFKPSWLTDESIWTPSAARMSQFGVDVDLNPSSEFKSMTAALLKDTEFEFGYPAEDMYDVHQMESMYVVVVVMNVTEYADEKPYRTAFQKDDFFWLLIEMLVLASPFIMMQVTFWQRIGWRVDRIECGLLHSAGRGHEVDLIALVLKSTYQNGSKANLDFRRNLYYLTFGARVVLLVPVILCVSYSFAMAFVTVPLSAGIFVFCAGIGLTLICASFVSWRSSGWRMSDGKIKLFGLGVGFLYAFLLVSVCYDMRVTDAGMPYSIFSVSCVAFSANIIPMIYLFFVDNDQMHNALKQLQRIVNKHAKMNDAKSRVQALGALGLKMAMLNQKLRGEVQDAPKPTEKNKSFGSLLGSAFTIDDDVREFQYSDIMRRTFTVSKRKRRAMIRRAYGISIFILFVYSLVVLTKCDPVYRAQGFGLSFALTALDFSLFALLRGECTWGTGQFIMLTFFGRASVAFFSGDAWIVGIGMAYFGYGIAMGTDIVNQRMQTIDSDNASSIAYFGEISNRKKRQHDASAKPEFVLGALSFSFLVSLLAYVFHMEDIGETVPVVMVGNQEWKVWIFGIAAFVVVGVSVVLGLATRALRLQRDGLLESKTYLVLTWISLPMELVALAELVVVLAGLLFFAITGSSFILLSCLFLPVIFGAITSVYTRWVDNNFSILELPSKRVELPDESVSDDENSDHEEAVEGKEDSQDELDDGSSEDETEEESMSLLGNLKKLNKRITATKPTTLTMPVIPFRKPMNKAQKIDRVFEEEEKETTESSNEIIENTEGEPSEKGEPIEQTEGSAPNVSEVERPKDPQDAPAVSVLGDTPSMEMVVSRRRGLNISSLKTKFRDIEGKSRAKWALIKDKTEVRVKKALAITEESDPIKMSAVEAFWHQKLTPADYAMMHSMVFTAFLILMYGIVIAATQTEAWWGHAIWLTFFFSVISFIPVRKYYGTQTITDDMLMNLKLSVFCQITGSIVIFVTILGSDLTSTASLWLFLSLFLWPAFLFTVVSVLIWRDNDWVIEERLFQLLVKCFHLFIGCSVLAFVFNDPKVALCFSILSLSGKACLHLIKIWQSHGYFLPIEYQHLISLIFNAGGWAFMLMTLIVSNNDGQFFCLSISSASFVLAHLAQLVRMISQVSARSTPLYFSTFIFPIFSLEPDKNDLVEQNQIGIECYKIGFWLLFWSACCIVFVDPLDFGVGVFTFVFVGIITLTCYVGSRTPIWLASATMCVDEKDIKESASQSRQVLQARKRNFEIVCAEYVQKEEDEAKLQRDLNKWNVASTPITGTKVEKRYSANEMVQVLNKASHKLTYDRMGKKRKDSVLSVRDALKDAFWTGTGPFGFIGLGGFVAFTVNANVTKKKPRKDYRVHAAGFAEKSEKSEKSDETDGEYDQLDRLIDELGPGGDVLKITVKDYDLTSANDELGFVEIQLDELTPDELSIQWHELNSSNEKIAATGKLQVQVELVNVWGGPDQDLQVRVTVLRAKGLRAADSNGLSDPFVQVECGTYSRRSAIVFKTLDPDWTETRGGGRFTFPPTDDTLQIEVKDKDLFTSDFLGGVDLYLPDMEHGVEVVQWYDLEGGTGKNRATGQVQLALLLSDRVEHHGLQKSKSSLQVTVIGAKGLRAADKGGTSDPFCVCKCGSDAFSTSVVEKTLAPRWTESYTFNSELKTLEAATDQLETFELLDSWAVYQQLPNLDASLNKEYHEEMRACALFQLLVVIASKSRKSKEAIQFQRFLREYRFKLLANKIEPPPTIFKSQSSATCDVSVVASWLVRLTPEQRQRFYALKEVFSKDVEKQEDARREEDLQYANHAENLVQWQKSFDQEKVYKQQIDMRRRLDEDAQSDSKLPQEQQIVTYARSVLQDIPEGLFVDSEFGMNSTQGIANESMVSGWKRSTEFNPNVQMFNGGTDPDDIFQGVLHDGWFLSALSILASSGSVGDDQVDPLIDNLFISKTVTASGAYAVRLYKNAGWRLVVVDDLFPALAQGNDENAGVAFCHSVGFKEMWVAILEKAYAKWYGTYSMLENGYVHFALETLTGFKSEEIFLLSETQGAAKTRLWEKMMRFSSNGFLMGCGTVSNNSSNAEQLDSGLMVGGCYTLYQVRYVDGHKLLQLRNPPGQSGEWNGDWGDQSNLWTQRLKVKLKWNGDNDDGTFWMSFDDFCLAFRSLYVCYYYDQNVWSSIDLKGNWTSDTSVGLPSKHNASCQVSKNPQWVFDVQQPTDLHFKITQRASGGSPPQPFSAYIIRTDAQRLRHVERVEILHRDVVAGSTGDPDRGIEKHLEVLLQPGFYILMVGVYKKGMIGEFNVHIDASRGISVTQLYPTPELVETVVTQTTEVDIQQLTTRNPKFIHRINRTLKRWKSQASKRKGETEVKIERMYLQITERLIQRLGPHFTISGIPQVPSDGGIQNETKPSKEPTATIPATEILAHESANWVKQYDPNSGKHYYYHKVTGESQWDEPTGFIPGGKSEEMEAASKMQALFRGKQSRRAMLTNNWVKQYDPNSGYDYYYDKVTGVTQWDQPENFIPGGRSEEMDAASKMQALFRGKQSRKQLQ